MTNESESLDQREYLIRPMLETNPYGAIMSINGNALEGATAASFWLDPFVPTTATLLVERGPEENLYENMGIIAYPACEDALWGTAGIPNNNDTLFVSVLWESSCTQPNMAVPQPTAGWFINNVTNSVIFPQTMEPYILPVAFDGYDLDTDSITISSGVTVPNFVGAEFQYREANPGNPWIGEPISYNELEAAFNADPRSTT